MEQLQEKLAEFEYRTKQSKAEYERDQADQNMFGKEGEEGP